MSDNHDFCRLMLKETRRALTSEQRRRLIGAWSYMYRNWGLCTDGEFHVRGDDKHDKFYWYGSACCAFDARCQGINAWFNENYPVEDQS